MSTQALTNASSKTSTTTTVGTTSTTKATTTNAFDPNSLYAPSMSNDYFGSQYFGNVTNTTTTANTTAVANTGTQTTTNAPQQVTNSVVDIYGQPDDIASTLLQDYINVTTGTPITSNSATVSEAPAAATTNTTAAASTTTQNQPITMEQYLYATQIANQFANQTPLISNYCGYTQRDFFAQQAIPVFNNTTQNVNNQTSAAKINYAA